jgi:hypothetical protein
MFMLCDRFRNAWLGGLLESKSSRHVNADGCTFAENGDVRLGAVLGSPWLEKTVTPAAAVVCGG